MKNIRSGILLITLAFFSATSAYAQTKAEKRAQQAAAIQKLVDNRSFVFSAQSAQPTSGGTIQLTSPYSVTVVKDTVSSYLPYFGVAYSSQIGQTNSPLDFTSKKFQYKTQANRNGNTITINFEDQNDVRMMTFNISSGGYGTLTVISTNRQSISFYGYLEPKVSRKKKDR